MRKILFILTLLFIANVGCKKMSPDGGGLCACSPVQAPKINMVIKNSTGADLLDAKNPDAYAPDKLKLFRKDKDGNNIPVGFSIRPPFTYGNEKFNFNSLAADISFVNIETGGVMYLQTAPDKVYEIVLKISQVNYTLDKVLVNNKEAELEKGDLAKFGSFFYLTE